MSSHKAFEEAVGAARLTRPLSSLGWCLATSVNVRDGDGFAPFYSRLTFGVDEKPAVRESHRYEEVELWEKLVQPETALSALGRDLQKPLVLGAAELRNTEDCSWQYQSPLEWWPGWMGVERCHYLRTELRRDNKPQPPRDALLAKVDGPSFDGFYSALKHWMHFSAHREGSDTRRWQLEVILPLDSGSVRSVAFEEDRIVVHLVAGAPNEKLVVQLAWEEDADQKWMPLRPTGDEAAFRELPADQFSVYVLQDDRIIDCYRSRRSWESSQVTGQDEREAVASLISKGENETCDFKKVLKGNPRQWPRDYWQGIARAVIAFANTRGGHVLLGVSDDGSPTGLDDVLKGLSDEEEQSRAALERTVRKRLQDELVNPPEMALSWVEIAGAAVLDVDVRPKRAGLVHDHRNNVWVRRGSTCRRPSPDELGRRLRQPFAAFGRQW